MLFRSPDQLVTRMKFDTKAEAPKLFFKATRWLEPSEYETCQEKGQSPEAQRAITMTVAQMDKVEAKPLGLEGEPPKAKAKPKAAPKPAAEEDDDVAEPEVRKEKAAPAPSPSKNKLADIAASWDTDDE